MSQEKVYSKFLGDCGRSDIDGLYYKKEDLLWIVKPTKCDPGLLLARCGAKPVKVAKEHVRQISTKNKELKTRKKQK